MQLSYKLIELPLEFTFTISRSSTTVAKTFIVTLVTEYENQIYTAYGEAVFSRYYGEDENSVASFYEQIKEEKVLDDLDPFDLDKFEKRIGKYEGHMAAKAGLDIALYDLRAKIKNLPLYAYLGLDPKKTPKTSYTIGIADLETIKLKTLTALERGYDLLKVKLGSPEDLITIETIRKLAPKATIRVDANAAWTVNDALAVLNIIKDYNIEFVEEPLKLGSEQNDYIKLYEESPLPLMADESCHTSQNIEWCAKYFHSINIKHTKCGGISEALRMIQKAKEHNLKIMLGCFSETTISIAAFAHISPLVDYADLDGSLLLKNEPFQAVKFQGSNIILKDAPGLGVVLQQATKLK